MAKKILLAVTLLSGTCFHAMAQVTGFGGSWTLNSVNATGYNSSTAPGTGTSSLPSLSSSTAQLLPNQGYSGAASSIFYNTAQAIGSFNASFTYTATGGGSIGDAVAFVIQNNSLNSVGSQSGNGATTIPLSFATAFSYNSSAPGNDFIIDGVSPVYSATGSLNLSNNQHPIKVTLSYNTITLYETITDTVTGTSYSTFRNVDINAVVGGQIGRTGQAAATTGYIGFTAGSSASFAGVTISNFTFTPITVPGIAGIVKPIVPNGWGACVAPNGYGGDTYQQTGVSGDWFFSPAQQTFFQQSGMTMIRADLTWDNVEFSQGNYNWSYYDGLINNLVGSGVTVMFILDYENALYTGNYWNPGGMLVNPGLTAFANFAAAAATHFAGKNVIFEIWNEPNFAYGYSGSQYSTFAIAAEQAMRTAVPNVTIIGPGEGELDPVWGAAMLSTGGGNLLNAYSFHPYSDPESMLTSAGYQGGFPAVTANMTAYPASNGLPLPMMASESGSAGDTLAHQASFYTRIYLTDQLYGLALNTVFIYQDATPGDNNPANNQYGMIYANNTAKPAYTAVKNLISSLNGYEQIGAVNTGNSNVYASIYQKGTSLAEAIWSKNSPGDSALPYIHYVTTGSTEYNQLLNAVYANSSAIIAPPSFTTQLTVTSATAATNGVPLGTPLQVTVTALDEYNNVTTNYNGTVHFTSTDSSAVLPGDAQLVNGVGTFNVTFNQTAYEYVTATDTVTGSLTNTFSVLPSSQGVTVSDSLPTMTINQGTTGQNTVNFAFVGGYNQNLSLSLAGLPTGVTATLSTNSFNASGSSVITFTVSPTAAVGTYPIVLTAANSSYSKTLKIPLTVGYGTSLASGTYLATGQYLVSPSDNCYLICQNNGSLVLYSGSDPNHQGAQIWSSNSTGSGSTFYTYMQGDGNLVTYQGAGPSTGGSFVWNSGTYPGTTNTLYLLDSEVAQIIGGTTVVWQAPSAGLSTFTVTASPASYVINQATAGSIPVVLNYSNGFSGTVTLSLSGVPAGVAASLSQTSFSGNGVATINLNVSSTAVLGTSSIVVQAVNGSTTRTATIPLSIVTGFPLYNNQYIPTNGYITSPSDNCYLICQSDGNLVLYYGTDPNHNAGIIWDSSTTAGGGVFYAAMQSDGNFTMNSGTPGNNSYLWGSGTSNSGPGSLYRVYILDSGEVEILSGTNIIWQTASPGPAPQTITFPPITSQVNGAVFPINVTASSGLVVTLSVLSGPATISGNVVTVTGAGTVVIAANQAGSSAYDAGTQVTQSFTTTQAAQTITFPALANVIYGNTPPTPNATSNSGLPITYSIVSGPATISGSTITLTGTAATVIVQASQAGNANYAAATSVTQSFTVSLALATGLVGEWAMDENTGTLTANSSPDSTVGSGTLVNGPTWTTPGHNGRSNLSFTASSLQYVSVPNTADLNMTSAISLTAWVNATTWSSTGRIIEKGGDSGGYPGSADSQYSLMDSNGSLSFNLTGVGTLTTTLPSTGAWHHIAATWDGATMKIYVDGTLSASQAATGTIGTSTTPLIIGSKSTISSTVSDYFNGQIDEPRVYNRALIAGEVSDLSQESFLTDGAIYLFNPQCAAGFNLEAYSTGNVDIYTANSGSSNQKWKAIYDGNSYWEFQPQSNTGERMDVYGGQNGAGTNVDIYTQNGQPSQLWKLYTAGTGYIGLEPQCAPGLRLDDYAYGASNNNNVQIYTSSGNTAQAWLYTQQVTLPQTITLGSIANQVYTTTPIPVTASASSGLAVTLTVQSGPATISGTNITLTGVGTVVIAANQGGNASYAPAPTVTTSFTVGQATQTITFPALANVLYGNTPPTPSATASSGLPITYSIVSGPATISGSTITLTGAAGTVVVQAAQGGNANYTAATSVTKSFVVTLPQTITLGSISSRTYTTTPFAVTASASSGLAVTLTVQSGPATISGTNVTLTGVGTVVIAANQAGNASYAPAPTVTTSFTVSQATQTITFPALANVIYGNTPPSPNATASSGLAITYSIVSGPATISGRTITLTGAAGTVVVQAAQGGNANYTAAANVTKSFVVTLPQTITLGSIANRTYTTTPFAVTASASSGLAVTLTVQSGPATISGTNVTLTGAGTVVIAANQAGNASYAPAPTVTTSFTVSQATQTITFPALANVLYGNTPSTPSAATTSGLAITYSIVSGPATISGSTITLTGAAGTVVVQAAQAGNANYAAATSVTQSFVVTLPQTITFPALANVIYGNTPPTPNATSNSGLPITYSIVSGPATISGSTITLTGTAATVIVQASQAGNANYAAATSVTQSFTVSLALATGLVGEWAMDENTGTLTANSSPDSTVGSGTLVNGPTWTTPGHNGRSNLSFTASSLQYVSVPNTADLNMTSAISLTAWVNATTWSSTGRIIEKGGDSGGYPGSADSQYSLMDSNGSLSFNLTGVGTLTTTLPSTGAWHHIAATWDGATMKIYVDGTLSASQAATGTIGTSTTPLIIGSKSTISSTVSDYFNGQIDEPRVYNRALIAGEVSDLSQESFLTDGAIYLFNPQCAAGFNLEAYSTGNVDIYTANSGSSNQKWKAIYDGNSYWEFQPQSNTGERMDVYGGQNGAGTNVDIYTQNGQPSQLWKLYTAGTGYIGLEPQCAPGLRLDDYAYGASNNNNVQIYTSSGNTAQAWLYTQQ